MTSNDGVKSKIGDILTFLCFGDSSTSLEEVARTSGQSLDDNVGWTRAMLGRSGCE